MLKLFLVVLQKDFYYKPRVDYDVLEKYHEGIIALSACLAGSIPSFLRRGLYDEAKQEAYRLQGIFGENNFFLELQDHGIPGSEDGQSGTASSASGDRD